NLYSPETAASAFDLELTLDTPPAVDSTAVAGAFDWAGIDQPLAVDQAQGDTLYFWHGVQQRESHNLPYASAAEVFDPGAVTLQQGLGQTLSGTFTPLTQDGSLTSVAWHRSEFFGAQAAVHPDATPTYQELAVAAAPFGVRPWNGSAFTPAI